jgi:hypothetical protein
VQTERTYKWPHSPVEEVAAVAGSESDWVAESELELDPVVESDSAVVWDSALESDWAASDCLAG